MSVRRGRRRTQLKGIDEINMTPLIDLTFLLLIVFMITMPLMEYGTDVSVPEMAAEQLPEDNTKTVNLRADGVFVIDKIEMNADEARATLERFYLQNPEFDILVRGDGECSYASIVDVVKMARTAGFTKARLVTAAE
ncbi:MAG: ExbD/TolR family protein [Victivallaceae bacterium]